MKRYIKLISCLIVIVSLFTFVGIIANSNNNSKTIETTQKTTPIAATPVSVNIQKTDIPEKTTPPINAKPAVAKLLSDNEIHLISLCVMGEAEGESDLGKRLVVDTILNRVDCDGFPDNIADVIYQPNAFECMWNGRVERCVNSDNYIEMMNHIPKLVTEELTNRHNSDVVFFCAGGYSDYGTPLFRIGNHYFSSN